MLQAFLKGKLSSEQENLEDLLTSSVFGMLAYIPPERALLPFLALARYQDGLPVPELQASGLKLISTQFWPSYQCLGVGPTEPDVVIELEDLLGRKHCVFIEVKLHSGKSSRPTDDSGEVRDQLAREWCVLVEHCIGDGARPHLLYVTSDPRYPELDVNESAREFASKRTELTSEFPLRCAWISWCKVATDFRHSQEPVLLDLSRLCERLDLVPFGGIPNLSVVPFSWKFSEQEQGSRFQFSGQPVPFTWRYE